VTTLIKRPGVCLVKFLKVFWVLCFEKVKIEKCFWWGPDLKNVVYGSIEENSFGKMKSLLKSKRASFLVWPWF
jgi:hypothetical protein